MAAMEPLVASGADRGSPAAGPALPIAVHGSELVAGAFPLLRGLPGSVTARRDEGETLVLGVLQSSAASPAALADFALGQVETQFLLLELEEGGAEGGGSASGGSAAGAYALLLPLISGGRFRATIRPPRRGHPPAPLVAWHHAPRLCDRFRGRGQGDNLVLRLESGSPAVTANAWPAALLAAAGTDPYDLVRRAVRVGARLSGLAGAARPREEKAVPPNASLFGWCSWDAYYSMVSAAGLAEGLRSLQAGGCRARWLVIDDGWQQTDVDEPYRAIASGRHLVGQSEVEVEEAAVDLVIGPADERETNTVHTLSAEEEQILSFTPRALTPRRAAAGNPFGLPPRSPSSGLLPSPRSPRNLPSPGKPAPGKPSQLRRRPASAAALLQGTGGDGAAAAEAEPPAAPLSPVRTPAGLPPIAPSRSEPLVLGAAAEPAAADSDDTQEATEAASACPAGGMAAVVDHLKHVFGLRHVYLWHAMMGFWAGVAPGGAMAKYGAQIVRPQPTAGTLEIDPSYSWVQATLAGVGLVDSPRELHADMHAYIAGCGVDGIKVDVQGLVAHAGKSRWRTAHRWTATDVGGPALAAAFHTSLEDSAARHFGSNVINCMCGSTDDFYPRNCASFTTHVSTCAFNSLFCGELAVPDWDMFHTKHPAAKLHATARAISGGPVYVSDKPGQHDFPLMRRLVLPDGSVLRCLLPGRPTRDCLFADFHDSNPPPVTARVKPADVPTLVSSGGAGGSFATYVDGTQELLLLEAEQEVAIELAAGGGSDMVTLAALRERDGLAVAPLGLMEMLNSGGAVVRCGWEGELAPGAATAAGAGATGMQRQQVFRLATRGAGTLLAYCSSAPAEVRAFDKSVRFEYDAGSGALRVGVPAGLPLEMDWTISFEGGAA
eukprot:scaffold1.g5545.t1